MRQWPWRNQKEAGRRAAFERLAQSHAADLSGAAHRLARNRDDAGDLVQDTLLQAYAAFDTFTPGTNFRAWTLRILTNNYLMLYRRRQRVRFVSWDDLPGADGPSDGDGGQGAGPGEPQPALMAKTMDPDLEAALGGLPESVRLAVLLVDVEAFSYDEAAAALGIPAGTVRSRLNRGRAQLRTSLAEFARERRLTPQAAAPSAGKAAAP